jgi:hypothetical protein
MALTDFFRINMPYGLQRNEHGEWTAFNREYQPLGYTKKAIEDIRKPSLREELPIFTKYKGLSETRLKKIISLTGEHFTTDQNGKINRVWLYKDVNNPADHGAHWPSYVEKLKILAKLEPKEL